MLNDIYQGSTHRLLAGASGGALVRPGLRARVRLRRRHHLLCGEALEARHERGQPAHAHGLRHRRVVLGARIGYVLFYGDGYYLSHPLEILAFNQGGMSFHGGLAGLLIGGAVAARMTRTVPFTRLPTWDPLRRRLACSSAAAPTS